MVFLKIEITLIFFKYNGQAAKGTINSMNSIFHTANFSTSSCVKHTPRINDLRKHRARPFPSRDRLFQHTIYLRAYTNIYSFVFFIIITRSLRYLKIFNRKKQLFLHN